MIAPPYLTVPPRGYGGIEQVVALLADGLIGRGHEVTLFASGGSDSDATLVSPLPEAPGEESLDDDFDALSHVLDAYLDPGHFDIVHDHTVHGTALGVATGRDPLVHTLHGPWTRSARNYYSRIDRRAHLVAISRTQQQSNPDVAYAGLVPNGIDLASHPFRADKDDYLVFVGRCNRDKGPEVAVEVARRAAKPLVMILKRSEPHERLHWEREVEPRLGGNETILEDLPHDDVVKMVGRARAMLFPIQWAEPFGLVMAEAMACGTPVVTRPLGAATEIVVDGETGFLRESVDELVEAIGMTSELSPSACRKRVAECYSAESMVTGYERVYQRLAAT
jgi:glycosyltransferase involved in cell wall biosynthesis